MAKLSLSYPDTWLTISVSIKNRDTWIEAFSGVMTEVSKVYKYDFVEVAWIDYIYIATCTGYDDMTGVIYAESTTSGWLSTEEHDKLMSLSGGGGWVSINYGAINSHTSKKINEAIEEIVKSKIDLSWIENTLNENLSQNEIANQNIIDTIKEIETDICKDISKESVATRQLVRQKAKKQEEFIQKQIDNESKTQKMIESEADEIEEELEQIFEKEADMIENEIIAQFEKEADDIESNLS